MNGNGLPVSSSSRLLLAALHFRAPMGCLFGARRSSVVEPEPPKAIKKQQQQPQLAASPTPALSADPSAGADPETPPADTPETASPASSPAASRDEGPMKVEDFGSPPVARNALKPLAARPLQPLNSLKPLSGPPLPNLTGRALGSAPLPKLADGATGTTGRSQQGAQRAPLKELQQAPTSGNGLPPPLQPLGRPLLPRSHTQPLREATSLTAMQPPAAIEDGLRKRPAAIAAGPPTPGPTPKTLPLPPPSSVPAISRSRFTESTPATAPTAAPAPAKPMAEPPTAAGLGNAPVAAAPAPVPVPAPTKSALARSAGRSPRPPRRLQWSVEVADRHEYEPGQERPVDDYRSNLEQLQLIRRQRLQERKSDCSFAELVSELDAAHGGEALSVLVPRKQEPVPGSWMSNRGMTWGDLNKTQPVPSAGKMAGAGYTSGGTSTTVAAAS